MTLRDYLQILLSIGGVVLYFFTIWLIARFCHTNDEGDSNENMR